MRHYLAFVREQWTLLLFGFLCVFWGNFGQSFFLDWYGEAIKQDLGISAQLYGSIYSAATLLSAMCIFWLGGLIDRWPLRRFALVVATGLFLAAVVLFVSYNLVVLALGFFLVRLFGQGLLPHAGLTTMARSFHGNRGKAISLASLGVSFGEVVLPLLVVYLLATLSWQATWMWLALSVPGILMPAIYLLLRKAQGVELLRQTNIAQPQGLSGSSGRATLLRDGRFWLAAPTLLSLPFMLTAIFIHQDFILREKQWSHEWLATCFVLYGSVHWLSSLVFGVLVDRCSGLRLLRWYTLPLLGALFLLANVDGEWVAGLVMVLLGMAIGASGPVVGSLWAEIYGTHILGGVRSTSGSLMVLSTAASPVILGWFIDHNYGLQSVFNGAGMLLLLAWCGLFLSYRKHI